MLRQKDIGQIYKVAVNAALGSFLFGYELVNISSLDHLYMNANKITKQQTQIDISFITSSLPLMAILGSAMLKKLIKMYKGRYLMIYMDILAIIGILIQDISLTFWPLFTGRLILGFCVGINSGLVAQYTFSVTPNTLSGSVGALRQVFLNVGVAIGYTLGFLINADNYQDQINWRILISFPVLTCIVRAVLLFTVLPYQIPLKRTRSKKIERMEKYYYKIYQNYALGNQTEFPAPSASTTITENQDQQYQNSTNETQSSRRNFIICVVLACSNQFCGINAIIFYAKQLFMRITDGNNNLSQIIIILLGVEQILSTFIGGKLMDKYPKRNFLFAGQICMVLILFMIFLFSSNIKLVVLLIFLHTVSYSFSIGQLMLFYAAKMLDSTGYVVMVNWFATFLVALSSEFMMKAFGIGNMCMIFCVLLAVCVTALMYSLPTDQQLKEKEESSLMKPLDFTTEKNNVNFEQQNQSAKSFKKNYQNFVPQLTDSSKKIKGESEETQLADFNSENQQKNVKVQEDFSPNKMINAKEQYQSI